MFQLTSVSVLWDAVVIFCSAIVVLTATGNISAVPLYSDSYRTADNAYRNIDVTVHSQHSTVLNESNLQSQVYLSALLHIYLFLPNSITYLRLNPINVLVISHGKLCRALLLNDQLFLKQI